MLEDKPNKRLTDELPKYFGEDKLRQCAKAIPALVPIENASHVESLIEKTCHATLDYLKVIQAGHALSNPLSSEFLDASVARTGIIRNKEKECWVPNYPVYGYITSRRRGSPAITCTTPLEPAVVLSVMRERDNETYPDFSVNLSVTDERDLHALLNLITDNAHVWDKFEQEYDITANDHISSLGEKILGKRLTCQHYLENFISNVVSNLPPDDKCFETFELEFPISGVHGLHGAMHAAISLLNALIAYLHIEQGVGEREDAKRISRNCIQSEVDIGRTRRFMHKAMASDRY